MGFLLKAAVAGSLVWSAGVMYAQAPIVREPPPAAPQGSTAAAPQGYAPAAPQGYAPAPPEGSAAGAPGDAQPQPGYPAAQPGYPAAQAPYAGPQPGYGAPPPAPPAGVPGPGGQPPGAADALAQLTSQPATHMSFTLDKDMLQTVLGNRPIGLNSVTLTRYSFHEPAFYVPEEMAALRASYNAAGWKHLVDAHANPRLQATPEKPMTDLWLHFHGTEIDDVAILVRAPKEMDLIQVSGMLRPLDLVHLGGHFGIPKVDPNAVMVPEKP
jgi:hypothetical protein